MDSVPRDLSGEQRQALLRLASQVMSILDLRRISGQKVAPQNDFTGGLESKPAGRALSESDIYRAVTQAALDAIIVIDEQSTILFANRSIERILGYAAEELVGQQLTVLMPDSLPLVRRQAMRESLETGEKHISWQQVVPALHKSGQPVALEVSFGEFVAGGKRLFTGICRDVTERKRIEDERFQLAAIVESSEDAVIGKNLDGIITTWNTGANRIYGYRAEEILGAIAILTPPERPE
jgi:PAS domain S-box-containing protein